jgi:regulator of RNase E activity RraB
MAKPTLLPDADSDAIARIVKGGSDLGRPMKVDFHVFAPSEKSAHQIASAAHEAGYATDIARDEGSDAWTCTCSVNLTVTHHELLRVQMDLDRVAHPFGGYSDGWGTFGNRENG